MTHDDLSCDQSWIQVDENRRKYLYQWGAQQEFHTNIVLVHGLGEHGGRYQRLAGDFAKRGFRVVCMDQQGHGKSPEKRGCIESYDAMLDDIQSLLQWVGTEKPCVLFGHSMGGNLVLNYALRRELQPTGIISSSPMIEAVRPPAKPLEFLLRGLLRLAPNFCVGSDVKPEKLMSDVAEQAALKNDELFHSQVSLRLGAALLDTGRWLLQQEQSLTVPVLLTHGTEDSKTSHLASKRFAERQTNNCKLAILNGSMHDPFRDVERDTILERYFDFMDSIRSKAAA